MHLAAQPFDTGACSAAWQKMAGDLRGLLGTGTLCALIGPRGTGKTQLAVHLMYERIKALATADPGEAKWPLYTRITDFFCAIRGTYHADSPETETQVARRYDLPQLLIIDELHERAESEFEVRALNNLIDKRYAAKVDTILISNQNKEELSASLGPSIISRLQETGQLFTCDWASFRAQGGGMRP
jgi:DNA replication protein DnaC